MNEFLNAVLSIFKNWDRGELPNYPDPAPPADLGAAMTQDEIDFVKKLKKEMTERFAGDICTSEKTGVSITDTTASSFSVVWTNPAGYTGTQVQYRVQGDVTWLTPNAFGNATGAFVGTDQFVFDTGFTAGTTYEILVRNACASGILSDGVMVSDIAA